MKELEFNKIGSSDRENGEVFKSGSNRHLIQPMRYRSGDLWIAVVMIVGQTPTAMTHKPTARPRETPSGMLVELRPECLLGDVTRREGALPTVGLQVRTLILHATSASA